MSRAWVVCAALATGAHALLLFAVRRGTLAPPRPLAAESSAVELSLVEAAPAAAPSLPLPAEPPLQRESSTPPPPEPTPPPVEPDHEPDAEAEPEPASLKPTFARRSRLEPAKPRTAVSPRTASTNAPPPRGSPHGAEPARGPSTSARPRYRSNPKPAYPAAARRALQEGVVILAVEVTAEGRAGSVRLSRSSGFPLLDAAALDAVRRWTFEPGRIAGLPTGSRVEVPVRFSLSR